MKKVCLDFRANLGIANKEQMETIRRGVEDTIRRGVEDKTRTRWNNFHQTEINLRRCNKVILFALNILMMLLRHRLNIITVVSGFYYRYLYYGGSNSRCIIGHVELQVSFIFTNIAEYCNKLKIHRISTTMFLYDGDLPEGWLANRLFQSNWIFSILILVPRPLFYSFSKLN